MVITEEFIQRRFVNPVAGYLNPENSTRTTADHLQAPEIHTFWHFLIDYMSSIFHSDELLSKSDLPPEFPNQPMLNKTRFAGIKNAIASIPIGDRSFIEEGMKLIRVLFEPSRDVLVDETIIQYFGMDMFRFASTNIPGKPHPVGLLFWGMFMKMDRCDHPLIIDYLPKTVWSVPTPSEALVKMTEFAKPWLWEHKKLIHVMADSGFSNKDLISKLSVSNTYFTISISKNHDKVKYEQVVSGLLDGQTQTITDGQQLIQAYCSGDKFTVVRTNYIAKALNNLNPPVAVPILSYRKTVHLFHILNTDKILDLVHHLDSAARTFSGVSKYLCGLDITFPEPDPDGNIILNAKTLDTLKDFQLREMLRKISVNSDRFVPRKQLLKSISDKISSKDFNFKEFDLMATEIEARSSKKVLLENAKAHMIVDPSGKPSFVAKYRKNYNLQDRFNRRYYSLYDPSSVRSVAVLAHMQLYHNLLYDIWVWMVEHRTKYPHLYSNTDFEANRVNIDQYPFTQFFAELYAGMLEEFPKILPGRPPKKHKTPSDPTSSIRMDTYDNGSPLLEAQSSFELTNLTPNFKKRPRPIHFGDNLPPVRSHTIADNQSTYILPLPILVSFDASLLYELSKKSQVLDQCNYGLLGGYLDSQHVKRNLYHMNINSLIFGFDPASDQEQQLIELEETEESLLVVGLTIGLPHGIDDLTIEHLHVLWKLEKLPPHQCVCLVWSIEERGAIFLELTELGRNMFEDKTLNSLKQSNVNILNFYNRNVQTFIHTGIPVRLHGLKTVV